MHIHVYCNQCGQELTITANNGNDITVEPCPTCLDEEWDNGFDAAKEDYEYPN